MAPQKVLVLVDRETGQKEVVKDVPRAIERIAHDLGIFESSVEEHLKKVGEISTHFSIYRMEFR